MSDKTRYPYERMLGLAHELKELFAGVAEPEAFVDSLKREGPGAQTMRNYTPTKLPLIPNDIQRENDRIDRFIAELREEQAREQAESLSRPKRIAAAKDRTQEVVFCALMAFIGLACFILVFSLIGGAGQ